MVFLIYIAAQTSKPPPASQYKKNMAKVKHPRPLLATVCCVTINQQQCLFRPIEARLLFSSTIKWARPFTASLTLLLIGPGTWSWQWPCFSRTLTFEGMHMHHNAIGKLRTKHWWLILAIFSQLRGKSKCRKIPSCYVDPYRFISVCLELVLWNIYKYLENIMCSIPSLPSKSKTLMNVKKHNG